MKRYTDPSNSVIVTADVTAVCSGCSNQANTGSVKPR